VNILAFDTSSSACSVALYIENARSGSQIFSSHELTPKQHTSVVLPMIQSLLDSAGTTLAKLDAIAFGCGPGSLTGVRVAASLAQGLAYAHSLPVIPVSSLAAAAQAAYMQHGWQRLLVAVDARMNQIYWGGYKVENSQVTPVFPEVLVTIDAIQPVPQVAWSGIGDGWVVYENQLITHLGYAPMQTDPAQLATGEAILCLAKERFKKKDWVDASEALPVYLR
jgi:tRNA threonylcarbamoyladenosine biosynthesis protein TsaB